MAEMKAKHAFGSSANLESAIASGIIDNYDLLFLDGETDPKVGWIDKDGNVRIVKNADVKAVDSLSESGEIGKVYIYNDEGYFWNGTEYKPLSKSVDLTSLEEQIASKASLDEVTAKIDSEIAKIDAAGTAESKVSEHNVSDAAHNDIRLLVQGLMERLNALADSDDTTLDQMSEVVAYIKSNKSLIDAITTSKVNVSDIIDNLTTNVSNKPLSAAQGVALKTMIDAIATVELDETLTDNTKAAPAGMVGELKGKIDNIHIPEQIQSDWTQNDETAVDYIKNRPFYDNSWVLDTSNVLERNDINSDVGFVLVSNNPDDFYLSDNNINYYGKYYNNTEYKLTISHYSMYDCEAFLYTDDDGNKTTICYVVRQENTSIKIYNAGTRYEISNPSIGIWVKRDPQSSKKASIYTKDVHKIDEKYLPDLSQLSEEIANCIKSPASAEVGQIVKIAAVDDAGKPTVWEAVDLPEQVQPDWNQNDDTAADYVKNRPFYKEILESVPLYEMVVELSLHGDDIVPFYDTNEIHDKITSADKYLVRFDGVDYTCTAVKLNNGYGLGNLSLLNGANFARPDCVGSSEREDTGEPFCIIDDQYYTPSTWFYAQTDGDHSYAVHKTEEIIHPISGEFIPDLGKHPDWNQDDETAVDFVKNRPILPISEIANYGVGFEINTVLKAVIINLTKDSNADGLTFINNTQYPNMYLRFNKKQIGNFQWYYDGEISFTNNTSKKVIGGQCNKDRFNITYDADGNIVNSNVYFKCFRNQVLLASVDQQEDEYKTPSRDTDPATKKYVDDAVADCIKSPASAEVGQTIVVKTVDETGKPIEFEMESVADEVDALVSLSECGILIPVYQNGTFYTDGNGFIYTL